MSNRLTKASLLAGTIMVGAFVSAPALAQSTEDTATVAAADETAGEAIVVTGSRIQRRDLEGSAPLAIVSDEEFKLSGAVNVESVINTLPQVIPGTTSFSNNPGGGVSTLDLRGLGEERSMVLVNGRRWMFYDTNQVVDLNTIPTFLIDNVDVVTGGASAIYGSDALAGVVNFRLKDVQGVEVGGQYGITGEGDGKRYQAHIALGSEFADGRGHATVYGEYYKRGAIFAQGRDFSRNVNWDVSLRPCRPRPTIPRQRCAPPATCSVRPVRFTAIPA
jgi:iron complex outermembrane recepter protein